MENIPKPPRWIIGALIGGLVGLSSNFSSTVYVLILGPIWFVQLLFSNAKFLHTSAYSYMAWILATLFCSVIGGLLLAKQQRLRIIGGISFVLWIAASIVFFSSFGM